MPSRSAIATWFFVLAVVRRGDAFLMVEESRDRGWYLPAGRVEPSESLVHAAVRETAEEAGVAITLDGLLRIEHSPRPNATRVRVIFTGHTTDPAARPRSTPNEHTLQARFMTLEELRGVDVRGGGMDVFPLLEAVRAGAPVAPLSMLAEEGAPWPR